MKKNLLLIIALFVATTMSAQFYAGLGLGYGMGASKRVNGTESAGTVETNIYGSYGQGFNTTLKLGYMFNDNMGLELGVSYLFGAAQTKDDSEHYFESAKSNGLRLMPQLVYKLDNGFYGRFGVIIPVMGSTVITSKDDKMMVGPGTFVVAESEMTTHGSFSIGFAGAIGYNFALNDNMNLFGELEYIGLSIKSGSAEYTKYEVGGVDQLPTMKTGQKEFTFLDEVDHSSDNTFSNPKWDPNQASVMLRQKAPFSSFGLNIGIVMVF
ncbi:MAG: porin family protein [Bacteroidales bacterium]|nr:porin family protein [Bacteroidales bacterium]